MRVPGALLLLALAAAAQPPVVPEFVRLKKLRENVAARVQQLAVEEENAKKPNEEKMLLAFDRGEKSFGKDALKGELVARTCLKWADVQQAQPTEAGKRVLALLPDVLGRRYADTIDVPKDRPAVAKVLLEGMDSDFMHVRVAAFAAIKKIYRKSDAMMYEPTMLTKKERASSIKNWQKFVAKQQK